MSGPSADSAGQSLSLGVRAHAHRDFGIEFSDFVSFKYESSIPTLNRTLARVHAGSAGNDCFHAGNVHFCVGNICTEAVQADVPFHNIIIAIPPCWNSPCHYAALPDTLSLHQDTSKTTRTP
ncbi:hypothetical protein Pelo_16504 [Pelomyxa schiedti]|nr:hypothetical protein Pelo_16504 [Pelomyxa schiedti]